MKYLNPFKTFLKVQEASSILRVDFTLSNYPHFYSSYLVKVQFSLELAVCISCMVNKRIAYQFALKSLSFIKRVLSISDPRKNLNILNSQIDIS